MASIVITASEIEGNVTNNSVVSSIQNLEVIDEIEKRLRDEQTLKLRAELEPIVKEELRAELESIVKEELKTVLLTKEEEKLKIKKEDNGTTKSKSTTRTTTKSKSAGTRSSK